MRKREKIIYKLRREWQAGATALMEIRDQRLYRAEGYKDFGKYCTARLQIGKSTANRQIAIGEVHRMVASTGVTLLPTSERQLRPLLCLRKPEQKPAVWGKKVEQVWNKAVNDANINRTHLTEKHLSLAKKQLGLDAKPKEAQPEADLQRRWKRLESVLEHEREFWQGEHLHELRVHIVTLLSGWDKSAKVWSKDNLEQEFSRQPHQ